MLANNTTELKFSQEWIQNGEGVLGGLYSRHPLHPIFTRIKFYFVSCKQKIDHCLDWWGGRKRIPFGVEYHGTSYNGKSCKMLCSKISALNWIQTAIHIKLLWQSILQDERCIWYINVLYLTVSWYSNYITCIFIDVANLRGIRLGIEWRFYLLEKRETLSFTEIRIET